VGVQCDTRRGALCPPGRGRLSFAAPLPHDGRSAASTEQRWADRWTTSENVCGCAPEIGGVHVPTRRVACALEPYRPDPLRDRYDPAGGGPGDVRWGRRQSDESAPSASTTATSDPGYGFSHAADQHPGNGSDGPVGRRGAGRIRRCDERCNRDLEHVRCCRRYGQLGWAGYGGRSGRSHHHGSERESPCSH